MHILRRITLALTNTVFRLVLFFSISALAFVFLYTSSDYIKSVLAHTNVYERIIPAFLTTNKDQPLGNGSDITLGDPRVMEIIENAYPPEDVELIATTIIDAFYDRIDGTEESLSFSIDLNDNQAVLAEGLAAFAAERVTGLPECTSPTQFDFDPFSTECRPPFLDVEQERERFEQQLLNEQLFIEDTVITEETLLGESSAERTETLDQISIAYQLARIAWIPILVFLSLLGVTVILLSTTRKRGIRKVGGGILGAALSLITFTIIFSFIIPQFTGSLLIFKPGEGSLDSVLNDVTLAMGQDYAWMTIKVCIPLVIIGLAIILIARKQPEGKYTKIGKKAGVISSNEKKAKTHVRRSKPPIQSSESSSTKPAKTRKSKKYKSVKKKVSK